MSFRISTKPLEVMWPITINVPANGGKTTQQKFSLKWRILDTAEFDKMQPAPHDFLNEKDDEPWVEMWSKVITGWKDIKGDKGEAALKFTPENLKNLIRIPYVQSALRGIYIECIMGRQVKN